MTDTVARAMQAEHTESTRRQAALRHERDGLTRDVERLTAEQDADPVSSPSNIRPDQVERNARLSQASNRLRVVEAEKTEVERRIGELSRLLRAPEAAAAAEDGVRQAQSRVKAAQAALDSAQSTVGQVEAAEAAERATAAELRGKVAAAALRTLPQVARDLLNIADGGEPAPTADTAASEHRLAGLVDAKARAVQIVEQRQQALTEAQAVEAAATQELLVQRAFVAELDHAEALASYLPTLGRWIAAHRQVHDFEPELPNLRQIIEESRAAAMREAQDEATVGLDKGMLRRGIKRISGALGL